MTPRSHVIAHAKRHGLNVEAQLEHWSERAAIREYEGGAEREEAEEEAMKEVCGE